MKLINDILYIEFAEMVNCGVSENYLRKAKSTGTKCWTFIDDPDDKRKVLIEFEKLKDDYRKKLEARYGNVYEYVAKMPIRSLVKWDDEAERFYLAHKYDGNKTLSADHVKKYTVAANWLNMFKAVTEDKRKIKELLKLTIEQFYVHALEIIQTDKIDLPSSYRRLLASIDKYKVEGYASLIDWRFGNKLAAKITDELSESVLLELIANPNQYDDVLIMQRYNAWASKNNYKTIDSGTVGVHRRKKEYLITMESEGNAELKNKFLRQAKGIRPSAPLYMIESDDNHLDLLFIDPDNTKSTPRYIAIVVTDSYNDYVLGYAYALAGTLSEGQSIALVRAAYTNAMYYIRSITGQWVLPHETKTDNWAIKSLKPFYQTIGKYIETPVGSKNRGYIENFFGSPHWKRCLKLGANNYVGNNLTAKYRGVNVEVAARNKKERPLIGNEAMQQIETFFHRLRHMPQSNGVSKHDQWLSAFNSLPETEKRVITDEQFLLKFGVEHNADGKTIRITNRGVEPQINGTKYSYDLEGGSWIEHVGKAVKVIYDPFDMSRVLITDFQNLRMVGRTAQLNPRALKDTHTDSRVYLNSILNERREDVEKISARTTRRKQTLDAAGIDAESLLQSGEMIKELKQAAEVKVLARTIDGPTSDDDYYDQM